MPIPAFVPELRPGLWLEVADTGGGFAVGLAIGGGPAVLERLRRLGLVSYFNVYIKFLSASPVNHMYDAIRNQII